MNHNSIGILGIGNLLVSDEGFGVHCLEYLEDNYTFPKSVHCLDGGTGAIMLTPFLEEHNHILIIDTTSLNGEPGTIQHFTDQQVRGANTGSRLSPHQVGLLETLDLCDLRGCAPEHLDFFAIIPSNLSTGVGLSPLLQSKLPVMSELVLDKLALLGHPAHPKACNPLHA